jgi:hypothetical protein
MREKSATQEREAWTSMFQPDVLAPVQYMEKWRYRISHEPEKMLMYAVLEDAVTCFQKFAAASDTHGRTAFREAEEWLMRERSNWFFSFEQICQSLNLDPDYIREGLRRWQNCSTARQRKIRLFYVVRAGRRVRKSM